jgi:hypothetical protein
MANDFAGATHMPETGKTHSWVAIGQALTFVMIVLTGCKQGPVEQCPYRVPPVSDDIPQFIVPGARDRLREMLQPGQERLNLHELYLGSHKGGYDQAVEDWWESKRFRFAKYSDVQTSVDLPETGQRGYWDGYRSYSECVSAGQKSSMTRRRDSHPQEEQERKSRLENAGPSPGSECPVATLVRKQHTSSGLAIL